MFAPYRLRDAALDGWRVPSGARPRACETRPGGVCHAGQRGKLAVVTTSQKISPDKSPHTSGDASSQRLPDTLSELARTVRDRSGHILATRARSAAGQVRTHRQEMLILVGTGLFVLLVLLLSFPAVF
jgi:hypothetical protein